jgi:hypothetical protein
VLTQPIVVVIQHAREGLAILIRTRLPAKVMVALGAIKIRYVCKELSLAV